MFCSLYIFKLLTAVQLSVTDAVADFEPIGAVDLPYVHRSKTAAP